FGLLPLDVGEMGADLLSLSGHKIYGPKGVGVLYARAGTDLPPLLVGGEQERGLRAGTLNTPAVVGMGLASELASLEQAESYERLASLQRHFIASLSQLEGVRLNGLDAPRSPKQLSVSVAGADGEALLMNLDRLGVYASSGSACAAGTLEPSHVLLAMGLERPQAKSSLRFSLGRALTPEMLDEATERLARAATLSRA
ncbi:MAG: aminotransferase class V-fold PLP-dependent enzyme, partial [Deinococcota bacterium]|nr:aminotransferase class V-fold PLP-dependent enzyme [Deinococcota bacterium]